MVLNLYGRKCSTLVPIVELYSLTHTEHSEVCEGNVGESNLYTDSETIHARTPTAAETLVSPRPVNNWANCHHQHGKSTLIDTFVLTLPPELDFYRSTIVLLTTEL